MFKMKLSVRAFSIYLLRRCNIWNFRFDYGVLCDRFCFFFFYHFCCCSDFSFFFIKHLLFTIIEVNRLLGDEINNEVAISDLLIVNTVANNQVTLRGVLWSGKKGISFPPKMIQLEPIRQFEISYKKLMENPMLVKPLICSISYWK